jgi:hypothetical protein
MREHSLGQNVTGKEEIAVQTLVLFWVATLRCLLQLCDTFEKSCI